MIVATNVTPSTSASPRLVRTIRRIASMSISPHATTNSSAAIVASGR